jgi:hypothetical protein
MLSSTKQDSSQRSHTWKRREFDLTAIGSTAFLGQWCTCLAVRVFDGGAKLKVSPQDMNAIGCICRAAAFLGTLILDLMSLTGQWMCQCDFFYLRCKYQGTKSRILHGNYCNYD